MNYNFKCHQLFYMIFLLIAVFLISGCQGIPKKTSPELQVVPNVDIDRYLGKWYEIALYPNWFEKGCFRSTAFYEKLKDGQIKVTNQCRMHSPEGKLNEAIGATVPEETKLFQFTPYSILHTRAMRRMLKCYLVFGS